MGRGLDWIHYHVSVFPGVCPKGREKDTKNCMMETELDAGNDLVNDQAG